MGYQLVNSIPEKEEGRMITDSKPPGKSMGHSVNETAEHLRCAVERWHSVVDTGNAEDVLAAGAELAEHAETTCEQLHALGLLA